MNSHVHDPMPMGQKITATYNKPNTEGMSTAVVSHGILALCECGKQFIRHDEDLPSKCTELE